MPKKYIPSEANDQKRVVSWLRGRGWPVISIPNEGKRSPALARHMADMGLTAGVPDLLMLRPVKGQVMWIEMKRIGGKLSPAQRAMHKLLLSYGHAVLVCYGEEDAKKQLTGWGI